MTQEDESALVPHAHRMELWGNAAGVCFPPLCANCGRPAHNRLTYKKQFTQASNDSENPNAVVITLVRVPFCELCIAMHKAEGPGPSLLANIQSRLHSGAHLLGTVGFGLAAAVAGYFALRYMGNGNPKLFYWLVSLTGFLILPTLAMASALRDGTEIMRIEWQNGITKAFDFSDSNSAPFRTPTFVCTMRSDAFARAFRELNQSLEFDPSSPAAHVDRKRAKRRFWIALVVFGGLAILAQLFAPDEG